VQAQEPGARVPVELLRDGRKRTLEVELRAQPAAAPGG
jgi:S1-C subfamily serine protease